MRNVRLTLVLGTIVIVVASFASLLFLKFPFPSTDLDYLNKKLVEKLGLTFEVKNAYKDIFGNVFLDVSYLPEFYASKVKIKYDDLFSFLLSGEKISFYCESNSINFADLSVIIGYLGLSDEERFTIATNVVNYYMNTISNTSISNLLVDRDVFYKYSDKFINAFVDVSVKMTKMELEVSKDVDKIKKDMEQYFYNFREDSYKEYLLLSSRGNVRVSSDVFIKNLDSSVKDLKNKLISYHKKVDDVFSKLSLLKEGYKIAWDERVKMIKSEPQKYIDRYVMFFPYYLTRMLIRYYYVDVPKVLHLRDVEYTLSSSNGIIYFTLEGKEFNSNCRVFADVVVSNGIWDGIVKYYNSDGNETYLDSGKKVVLVKYVFKPFMDTLNGEYKCKFIYSTNFNFTNFVYSTLTNISVVGKVINYMFSEEGFVDSFINEEVDNLFRSYSSQYERYKKGILEDVNKLKKEFYLEVEKEKIKLRKSYQM